MERQVSFIKNITIAFSGFVPVTLLVLLAYYFPLGTGFTVLFILVYTLPSIFLQLSYLVLDFRKKVSISDKSVIINNSVINKSDVVLVNKFASRLSHFGGNLNPYRMFVYYEIVDKTGKAYLLTNLLVNSEDLKIEGLTVREVITFYPLPYPIKTAFYKKVLKFWK